MRGPRLIIVTDPAYTDDAILRAIEAAAGVVAPGVLGVQLRDKQRDVVSLRVLASRLRVLTRAKGAWLVINGDARLAKDVGADGVHLGGRAISIAEARGMCGASAWISIAAHSDSAVRAAVREGADAVLVSPIFPTTSGARAVPSQTRMRVATEKKRPRGVEAIEKARAIAESKIAVYALGGVTPTNAAECVTAGADGIAVIRAILASTDPGSTTRAFAEALGVDLP